MIAGSGAPVDLIGTPRADDPRERKICLELELDLDLGRPLKLRGGTRSEWTAADRHVDEIKPPAGQHLDRVGVEHRGDPSPATAGELPELHYEDLLPACRDLAAPRDLAQRIPVRCDGQQVFWRAAVGTAHPRRSVGGEAPAKQKNTSNGGALQHRSTTQAHLWPSLEQTTLVATRHGGHGSYAAAPRTWHCWLRERWTTSRGTCHAYKARWRRFESIPRDLGITNGER